MNRNIIAIIAIFLVQSISPQLVEPSDISLLNPETKLPDPTFKEKFGIVEQAIYIYKLDAQLGTKKEDLCKAYRSGNYGSQETVFDIDQIDVGKKGWTRYYQFQIRQNRYTIKIFLTEETAYQQVLPAEDIICQGSINTPPVTFQILPNINEILGACNIKPHRINSATISETGKSL